MIKEFSYSTYAEIMKCLIDSGKYCSFYEAQNKDRFAIMRHDVEFSIERAYQLARFEQSSNFQSTFCFQVSNNSYNPFSKKNLEMIKTIKKLGHDVGLHFHLNGLTDLDQIKQEILKEAELLSMKVGFDIDLFSIHRPTKDALRANIRIDGLINTYDSTFFSFVEDIISEPVEIKYLSDARHRWNYGLYPDSKTINSHEKVQVLTHPYSWTPLGHGNLENFRSLIAEKEIELIDTIDNECTHFGEIKDAL